MVLVEWHLVDVTENAPVYEMTNKSRQPCNSITLDLIKCHLNVHLGDLLGGIMKRLSKRIRSLLATSLTLGSSNGCRCRWIGNILRGDFIEIIDGGVTTLGRQFWIPANGSHHCHLVLRIALLHLCIAHMRDVLDREILDKLSKVPPDVCHSDIERLLELDKPITISDLLGWKEILVLGHLGEGVGVDDTLRVNNTGL